MSRSPARGIREHPVRADASGMSRYAAISEFIVPVPVRPFTIEAWDAKASKLIGAEADDWESAKVAARTMVEDDGCEDALIYECGSPVGGYRSKPTPSGNRRRGLWTTRTNRSIR